MPPAPRDLLPLKPLVFQILLALSGEERHGWSLVKEIQDQSGGERVMPANFYRTLRTMLEAGLVEESGRRRPAGEDERRRYFRLTAFGEQAARLEAARLRDLVADVRMKRLLKKA
jgi:DNA-binding PadR family transcriptional regulator